MYLTSLQRQESKLFCLIHSELFLSLIQSSHSRSELSLSQNFLSVTNSFLSLNQSSFSYSVLFLTQSSISPSVRALSFSSVRVFSLFQPELFLSQGKRRLKMFPLPPHSLLPLYLSFPTSLSTWVGMLLGCSSGEMSEDSWRQHPDPEMA